MPNIYNKALLQYNSTTLYNVITDVESYNKFIPWCESIEVIERKENTIICDVKVKFLFIKAKYRSIATLRPEENGKTEVIIKMISGPFSHFTTIWRLQKENENETSVDFHCNFSFNNSVYNGIATTTLTFANKAILEAFEKRIKTICNANK